MPWILNVVNAVSAKRHLKNSQLHVIGIKDNITRHATTSLYILRDKRHYIPICLNKSIYISYDMSKHLILFIFSKSL